MFPIPPSKVLQSSLWGFGHISVFHRLRIYCVMNFTNIYMCKLLRPVSLAMWLWVRPRLKQQCHILVMKTATIDCATGTHPTKQSSTVFPGYEVMWRGMPTLRRMTFGNFYLESPYYLNLWCYITRLQATAKYNPYRTQYYSRLSITKVLPHIWKPV